MAGGNGEQIPAALRMARCFIMYIPEVVKNTFNERTSQRLSLTSDTHLLDMPHNIECSLEFFSYKVLTCLIGCVVYTYNIYI